MLLCWRPYPTSNPLHSLVFPSLPSSRCHSDSQAPRAQARFMEDASFLLNMLITIVVEAHVPVVKVRP